MQTSTSYDGNHHYQESIALVQRVRLVPQSPQSEALVNELTTLQQQMQLQINKTGQVEQIAEQKLHQMRQEFETWYNDRERGFKTAVSEYEDKTEAALAQSHARAAQGVADIENRSQRLVSQLQATKNEFMTYRMPAISAESHSEAQTMAALNQKTGLTAQLQQLQAANTHLHESGTQQIGALHQDQAITNQRAIEAEKALQAQITLTQ